MRNGIEIHEWVRITIAELDALREEYGRQFALPKECVGWREKKTRRGTHLWMYINLKALRHRNRKLLEENKP